MTNIKHTGERGTVYGYIEKGCRCAECEAAYREKCRRQNTSGRKPGGQPRPMPDHGTGARYQRGCRCRPCKDANNARKRKTPSSKAPPRKVAQSVVQVRAKSETELRILGSLKPVQPRTYEPEPDVCGLELSTGGECRRRVPCSRPEHQETT